MRAVNAAAVLDLIWNANSRTALTATEIMAATGLTRATVLNICDGLTERAWLQEDLEPSAIRRQGRQPRSFRFNATRHYVAAADVGFRSVTTVVADLQGQVLGRYRYVLDERELWSADRTTLLLETMDAALESAGVAAADVRAVCLGVAAPVEGGGAPLPDNELWEITNVDLQRLREPGWHIEVANDANLAALAELNAAEHPPKISITLLAAERLGAGIVVDGVVLRGAHGAAGELAYLTHVRGAQGGLGLVPGVVDFARAAILEGRASTLAGQPDVTFQRILAAAREGDPLAQEALDTIVERLAAAVSTMAGLLDPEELIVAGGAAGALEPLLPRVASRLAELALHAPRITASRLGRDVVLIGATHRAIERVRATEFTA